MSTLLNGVQTDQAVFSRDINHLVNNVKAAAKASAEPRAKSKNAIQPASTVAR
jgi:hypothetical protein